MEAGCGWIGEHGPGAVRARCSPQRVRPSSRRSVLALREASAARLARNQGGTASFSPLTYTGQGFLFEGEVQDDMGKPIIELKGITKIFGTGDAAVTALKDVDLTIDDQ